MSATPETAMVTSPKVTVCAPIVRRSDSTMKEQFDTDSIRKRNPIVGVVSKSVALKRSAATFTGFCPFHDNRRTPSFVVWPETGTWKCFGVCAEGGDVIAFVMKRDGISFVEACERLGGEVTA